MLPNKPSEFITELPTDPFDKVRERDKAMKSYVDRFDSRMAYAKWKQYLVLMYNYEPLASVIKKTEEQKQQYIKKIYDENQTNQKLYNTEQITKYLESFKEFSDKLENKLQQLQIQIDKCEMSKQILMAELEDKKLTLKRKLQENLKINSDILRNKGVYTKEQIVGMLRKKADSMKSFSRMAKTDRKNDSSIRLNTRKQSYRTETLISKNPATNKLLFDYCLYLLVKNIRSMNSSEDIQQGIFLDLLTRDKSRSVAVQPIQPKPTGRGSLIYDILAKSYNEKKKKEFEFDFVIEWYTFRRFNWRQMMGVLMMREGCYEQFKQLAVTWN